MRNNRFLKILVPDTRIYLIIIAVFIALISVYNYVIGILGILLLAYLVYYNLKITNIRRAEWTQYVEGLSSNMDTATKQAILNLPIPMTMIEFDGAITWYNSKFMEIIGMQDILEKNIQSLVPEFNLRDVLQNKKEKISQIKLHDRYFTVLYNIVKLSEEHGSSYIIMLYWVEKTAFLELKKVHEESKPVVALIQVDNYDEVMQAAEESIRPMLSAEIEHKMNLWSIQVQGLIRKYSKDKYVAVFHKKTLESLESKKFDLLDEIREINLGNRLPFTLSIGVGLEGSNLLQSCEFANAAKDLALGRGGDQAVVKKNEKISFYGGKTKAVEKRTKVKARVISHALKQLMEQSDNVLVMGHRNADLDSLGSAIGIYCCARNLKKEAHIVLNSINPTIKVLMDRLLKLEEYQEAMIKTEAARQVIQGNTLLVVVDTHRPSLTEAPELLKMTDKVVVIDHHRRSTEFIENPVLSYHETFVSSTCEMVTEILFYMEDKMNVSQVEAEALLSGIALDTKNFTFKTGVRTFEAASMLRRAGADTTEVKFMFQDDYDTIIARADVVKRARIIRDNVALSTVEKGGSVPLIAAQAADELLNIRGITASFVLGKKEEGLIFISGRSLGEINVQVILEKLGGGGHLTVAGAQLEGYTMEEAVEKVTEVVNEYFEEGEGK